MEGRPGQVRPAFSRAVSQIWTQSVFPPARCACRLEDGEKSLSVTPYEKNIEVWKQLWRVVERSDLLIQIVDARNPTLFR